MSSFIQQTIFYLFNVLKQSEQKPHSEAKQNSHSKTLAKQIKEKIFEMWMFKKIRNLIITNYII